MNANNDRIAARAQARLRRAQEKAIHDAARAERLKLEALARVKVSPVEWFTESPNIYIAHGTTPRDVHIDYLRGRAVTLRDHALKRAKFYADALTIARSKKGKQRAERLMHRAEQRAKDIYEDGMRELKEYIATNPAPAAKPTLPPLPYTDEPTALPPLPYGGLPPLPY